MSSQKSVIFLQTGLRLSPLNPSVDFSVRHRIHVVCWSGRMFEIHSRLPVPLHGHRLSPHGTARLRRTGIPRLSLGIEHE